MAIDDAAPAPVTGPASAGGPPGTSEVGEFFTINRHFKMGVLQGLAYVHQHHGTFVRTRLPLQLYFISDPVCVDEILVKKPELFRKDRTTRLLSACSEGACWSTKGTPGGGSGGCSSRRSTRSISRPTRT